MQSKLFKVAAVSVNTNSFGLYQMMLISQEGATFTACKNSRPEVGLVVRLDVVGGLISSDLHFDFEIPNYIGKAPKHLVKDAWP